MTPAIRMRATALVACASLACGAGAASRPAVPPPPVPPPPAPPTQPAPEPSPEPAPEASAEPIALTQVEAQVLQMFAAADPTLLAACSASGRDVLLKERSARVIIIGPDGVWRYRTEHYVLRSVGGAAGDLAAVRAVLADPTIDSVLCMIRDELSRMTGVGSTEDCTIIEAMSKLGAAPPARRETSEAIVGGILARAEEPVRAAVLRDDSVKAFAESALVRHASMEQRRLAAAAGAGAERAPVDERAPVGAAAARLYSISQGSDKFAIERAGRGGAWVLRSELGAGQTVYVHLSEGSASPQRLLRSGDLLDLIRDGKATLLVGTDGSEELTRIDAAKLTAELNRLERPM